MGVPNKQRGILKLNKIILVIEDEENLNRGIVFAFQNHGLAVLTANTYAGGLAKADTNSVDIFVIDLNLPDGDGISFCK